MAAAPVVSRERRALQWRVSLRCVVRERFDDIGRKLHHLENSIPNSL